MSRKSMVVKHVLYHCLHIHVYPANVCYVDIEDEIVYYAIGGYIQLYKVRKCKGNIVAVEFATMSLHSLQHYLNNVEIFEKSFFLVGG